jgi:hypothetical protein
MANASAVRQAYHQLAVFGRDPARHEMDYHVQYDGKLFVDLSGDGVACAAGSRGRNHACRDCLCLEEARAADIALEAKALKRIKAGERNPDLLCESAVKEFRERMQTSG